MGSETSTPKFITFTLQLLQIKTGQANNILLQDFNKVQNLATDSWIKSLWEFINGQNIQILSTKKLYRNKFERKTKQS